MVAKRRTRRPHTVSVFTSDELDYLTTQGLARMATVGRDGRPHIIPVTYTYNADEDSIDVGGIAFGEGKKWRDAKHNPKVTMLIDDVIPSPRRARALEVRGDAELHETGGDAINPRFKNFTPQFFRIRPKHIVSWGLEDQDGATSDTMRVNSRSV
jgi:pyridoxamine 5'-phosphate oxidase family protein